MPEPPRELKASPVAGLPPSSDVPSPGPAYVRALDYLYSQIDYERLAGLTSGYPFRLQRMAELLKRLGLADYLYQPDAPPPSVPLVHIAGTKGKGSTAAMAAAMLTAGGLRTGLYTSPHLERLEERFRVNGELCSEEDFVALVDQVRSVAAALSAESKGEASFFELTTAMAVLHFHRERCDAIVLEVGLGGRLDSTNVCLPSVTAITSIGLDHQHVLGDTLNEIAAEKAGIIKPHVPVVCGVPTRSPGVEVDAQRSISASKPVPAEDPAGVIAEVARQRNAPLYQLGVDFDFTAFPAAEWGNRVEFRGSPGPLAESVTAELLIEGEHQGRNAAIAIAVLQLLRDQGCPLEWSKSVAALAKLGCDARIERFQLPDDVVGIIDAAHNADSVAALCQTLELRLRGRPTAIVFGTSIDKSAEGMLSQLSRFADQIVLTRFHGNPRYLAPDRMRPLVPGSIADRVQVWDDPRQACQAAWKSVAPGGAVVVCGSFFLAAETRPWMQRFR